MATDPNVTTETREAAPTNPLEALQEWRKKALTEGIAPTNIDSHLLGRTEVPETVKTLIKQQMVEQGGRVPSEGLAPQESPVQAAPTEAKPGAVPEAKPDVVSGEVPLGTKSEISKMMEETRESEGIAGPEAKPETPEMVEEEAEKKEPAAGEVKDDTAQAQAAQAGLGMSGYEPSQDIADNSELISEKGSVREGKTWQAALLQRLKEMWGNLLSLFSK